MYRKIGEFAEVRMGYSFRSRLEAEASGDVAVIQMKDIDDSNLLHPEGLTRVQMPDLKDRHLVQEGDLLFRSRGGSNSASLVAACLGRTVLAAPMMLIRPQLGTVDPAYLQWYINQRTTQNVLANQAEGTAVKMISKAALEQLPVAIPTLEIQRRIVEIGHLSHLETQLTEQLMNRRKALIERILMRKAQSTRGNLVG